MPVSARMSQISFATAAAFALTLAACGAPATDDVPPGNAVSSAGAAEPSAATPAVAGPGAPPAPASGGQTVAPSPAATAWTQDRYLGHWTGVEGMVLDVAARPEGGVRMKMRYDLDHQGTYDGSVTAEGLRFVRNGEALTATPTDGDATGLKWLAGKKECLTVKPGEGYCRN